MTTMNTVEVTTMLADEDLTLIFLAQQGDENSMLKLVKKYGPAIHTAAMRYADTYGQEDCYAEARCAFIERVHKADPSNLKKFRSYLVKELADAIVTRLNPYGLTRRALANADGLYETVPMTNLENVPDTKRVIDGISVTLNLEMWLALEPEEYRAVEAWLEYPRMTEAEVADEIGVPRSTFQRRLAVAFSKLRVRLGGDNE